MAEENLVETKKKKISPRSIKLQMAGDLILARCSDRSLSGLFKRYEAILETFANMEKLERILNYKFLIGLILTSHAKKAATVAEKKHLFDLKNELYFNIANNRNNRRLLAFRYLHSKNFRVVKFCDKCTEANTKENVPRHDWKFCKDCEIDRKFYNVLSMHHKFDKGSATLFLSNDLIDKIIGLKQVKKGNLAEHDEEARYDKYLYNVRNLDIFELQSVLTAYKKLMDINP